MLLSSYLLKTSTCCQVGKFDLTTTRQIMFKECLSSDGSVVVPKATLHWSKQTGDTKLFYVRPVDGSGDRKILSPPAVVVRWKG